MQKSMLALAFLPYLHWFGSLVHGAVVLTSPSPLVQPSRPNGGLPGGFTVVDKERGPELPAAQLFQTGILLMADILAPEDFFGSIPSHAWNYGNLVLGVTVDEQQGGVVQRAVVLNALYFIFLLMKQEKNFRSGVFEIQFLGYSACDIVIFSTTSSGLHLAPGFPPVTQLNPPPSSIANNTKNSLQLEQPDPGMGLKISLIMPFLIHPMDELGQLINIVDMLLTIAEPPANEAVHKNTESSVPSSGVKLSLNLTQDDVPHPLTYADLIWAVGAMWEGIDHWGLPRQALRGEMSLDQVYQGELLLVPSTSSPSTSRLIEASSNTSTGTATARKRWSMV